MVNPQPEKHGPTADTLITRIVVVAAVIGTLAIITAGVLFPKSSSQTTSSSNSSTGAVPVVGLHIGNAAPNFTLSALDGKKVSLSDYRGKPVMLNFWYATCPGCMAEIPGMQNYYARQHAAGKDQVILGVNVSDDSQTAAQFVQSHRLTYPVVLDNNQQVLTLYNVTATPTSYFIDRQGIIRLVVVAPLDDTALQQDMAQIS